MHSMPRGWWMSAVQDTGAALQGEMEEAGLSRSGVSIRLCSSINSQVVPWVVWFEGFINHNDGCSEIFLWNMFLGENINLSLLKHSKGMYVNLKKNGEGFSHDQQISSGNLTCPVACLPCMVAAHIYMWLSNPWKPCSWAIKLGLWDCQHPSGPAPELHWQGPMQLTESYKGPEDKGLTHTLK